MEEHPYIKISNSEMIEMLSYMAKVEHPEISSQESITSNFEKILVFLKRANYLKENPDIDFVTCEIHYTFQPKKYSDEWK